MHAVVSAAGEGARLRPSTGNGPTPLAAVPLHDRGTQAIGIDRRTWPDVAGHPERCRPTSASDGGRT